MRLRPARVSHIAILAIVVGIAATSCRTSRGEEIPARLVVDQPVAPIVHDPLPGSAVIVADRAELDRQWKRFGLGGTPPGIDFEKEVVMLVGFGESGSCPYEYEGVRIERDIPALALALDHPGGGCTSDYNPRTIGVALRREDLPTGVVRVYTPDGGRIPVRIEERPV